MREDEEALNLDGNVSFEKMKKGKSLRCLTLNLTGQLLIISAVITSIVCLPWLVYESNCVHIEEKANTNQLD